jgi:polysaccharide pyruvyl transferase WcaK-like protein
MRLHSLIYSLAASVPFVALSYDPKVRSFAEYAEMPYVLDAPAGWENGMLIRAATDILENADAISEREKLKTAEFRRLAERDGSLAAELALKQ